MSQIEDEQDLVHIIWRHHLALDENNALISTFEMRTKSHDSQLYISFSSNSHERSAHSDANNS